jgi:prenyltransferase beta subunit
MLDDGYDDTTTSPSWREELIHWCVHRQADRGMQGRPNKAEDTW